MAADIAAILKNLSAFYDFSGKTMVAAGAGGGQFAEYGRWVRRVTAVDLDSKALETLRAAVARLGLNDRFAYWQGDFFDCAAAADVVLFEFCLHEMDDPVRAIAKALELAPDVVIIDHASGSPWSFCAAEDDKVSRSWRAVTGFSIERRAEYACEQRFADFSELETKVRPQGEESLRRIEPYRGRTEIVIPMAYALAWVRRRGG